MPGRTAIYKLYMVDVKWHSKTEHWVNKGPAKASFGESLGVGEEHFGVIQKTWVCDGAKTKHTPCMAEAHKWNGAETRHA